GLDCHVKFRHVKSCNVLGEDLILDKHSHQVTTGQEFHEQVEIGRILEGGMQLHKPRVILRVGQNITLGANMSQLVLLEHLGLDQGFQSVNLAISPSLHESDFAKGTLSNDLDCLEVVR